MTFFPEPIRPSKEREKNQIPVDPIEMEANKKDQEPHVWELPADQRKTYYGALITMLRECVTLSLQLKDQSGMHSALSLDILFLQELLHRLMETDQSQNSRFAQALSQAWHALLVRLHTLSKSNKMGEEFDFVILNSVVEEMDDYSSNQEKTLGFYLTELHEKDWLPTPFIDMLYNLHHEYQFHRDTSHLQKWSTLLKKSQNLQQKDPER